MFEDQQDTLEDLLKSNDKFRQLHERHQELHSLVHDAESGVTPRDSFTVERMKKEKLYLKDQLAAMMREFSRPTA